MLSIARQSEVSKALARTRCPGSVPVRRPTCCEDVQLVLCYACCVAFGTVLLKPHVMQVKLLHFGQKKFGYDLTVALTIHSYVTIGSIFEKVRSNEATNL